MSSSPDIPDSHAGDVDTESVHHYPPHPSEEAMSVSVNCSFYPHDVDMEFVHQYPSYLIETPVSVNFSLL